MQFYYPEGLVVIRVSFKMRVVVTPELFFFFCGLVATGSVSTSLFFLFTMTFIRTYLPFGYRCRIVPRYPLSVVRVNC